MPRRPARTVERPIYFAQTHRDGVPCLDAATRLRPTFDSINQLDFRVGNRYLGVPDSGRYSSVSIDRVTPPPRLQVGWITDQDLPRLTKRGRTSPIRLAAEQYLYYPSHVVFFEGGVIGYESSRSAPTPGTLGNYLTSKGGGGIYSFEPIFKPEVAADLRRLVEIHCFTLRIPLSRAAVFQGKDRSTWRALKNLQDWGDSLSAEVTLKPEHRGGTVANMLARVKRISRDAREDGLQKLTAIGYDESGTRLVLDLLNPRLIQKREMVLQDATHRAVDAQSAYSAIESAYQNLRDAIDDSLGRTL